MPHHKNLDIDIWMTVHHEHPISCDTFNDEVRFRIGPTDNGLVLCLSWAALTRFLRVARQVAKLSAKKPAPGATGCEVFADMASYLAHRPHGALLDDDKQIILRAASGKNS